jgi:hypothetical protein
MPVSHRHSSLAGTHLTGVHLEAARRTRIVSPADRPSNCVPGYFPFLDYD